MKSKADPRHSARKLALASIFSWLFSEPNDDECVVISKDNLFENSETYDSDLHSAIVNGVKLHREAIDGIIQECAPEWPIDKISKVDLVILRIATYEIAFGKKTPIKVAIDEAVELAKEFGGDTSHKFVNGVLGTIVEKYVKKEEQPAQKAEGK